jgi:hypothetical protein
MLGGKAAEAKPALQIDDGSDVDYFTVRTKSHENSSEQAFESFPELKSIRRVAWELCGGMLSGL